MAFYSLELMEGRVDPNVYTLTRSMHNNIIYLDCGMEA